MTSQEKLQQLFDAALKDTSEFNKAPTQAFPRQSSLEAVIPAQVQMHAPSVFMVNSEGVLLQAFTAQQLQGQTMPLQAATMPVETAAPAPVGNFGLDEATSTELGLLLDEQRARLKSKRVRDTLIALACCLALTGGGAGWFVSSPARVQAFTSAIKEIRSAGDIKGLLATYQKSLDRIAKRGGQIDKATLALGGDPNAKDEKDPNMDAEMKEMMGGDGKTMGDRNRALQSGILGKFAEQASKKVEARPVTAPAPVAKGGGPQVPPVAQVSTEVDFSVDP